MITQQHSWRAISSKVTTAEIKRQKNPFQTRIISSILRRLLVRRLPRSHLLVVLSVCAATRPFYAASNHGKPQETRVSRGLLAIISATDFSASRGQTPAEADLNLLETARRCELYGMKMHAAKDHEGVPLNLAVAHMGLAVFQGITRINTFSWAKIRKISFKRKKLLIKLHPEGYVSSYRA